MNRGILFATIISLALMAMATAEQGHAFSERNAEDNGQFIFFKKNPHTLLTVSTRKPTADDMLQFAKLLSTISELSNVLTIIEISMQYAFKIVQTCLELVGSVIY